VYLTYCDLFCGSNARVRNRKVIHSIILKHWAQFGTIIHEHYLEKTVIVLKTLLKDHVFEFERTARKMFLDLLAKSLPVPPAITASSKHDAMAEGLTNTEHERHRDNLKSLAPHVSYSMFSATHIL
jgi:hypothetical protein